MRSWFSALTGFAFAVVLVFASHARCADAPSSDSYKPPSVDETLNDDSTTSQSNLPASGEGSFGAQQIVNDARLAHQLTTPSNPANDDLISGSSGIKKSKHSSLVMIIALAVGGFVLAVALLVFAWSRIVNYREMRDSPAAFQFTNPPNRPRS